MSPDEQAERDAIARVLDTLITFAAFFDGQVDEAYETDRRRKELVQRVRREMALSRQARRGSKAA